MSDEDEGLDDVKDFTSNLPQKGDKLFIHSGGPYASLLNFMGDSMPLYVTGYKVAADTLVQAMKLDPWHSFHEVSRSEYLDSVVYPILFLYRHYIELRLKHLMRDGNSLLGKPFQEGPLGYPTDGPKAHDLDHLWNICKKVLEEVDKKYPDEKICPQSTSDAMSELITEFWQEDPKSMASRFPKDKKGNPSFSSLTQEQMRHVARTMEKIHAFFEKADFAIWLYMDFEQEKLNGIVP